MEWNLLPPLRKFWDQSPLRWPCVKRFPLRAWHAPSNQETSLIIRMHPISTILRTFMTYPLHNLTHNDTITSFFPPLFPSHSFCLSTQVPSRDTQISSPYFTVAGSRRSEYIPEMSSLGRSTAALRVPTSAHNNFSEKRFFYNYCIQAFKVSNLLVKWNQSAHRESYELPHSTRARVGFFLSFTVLRYYIIRYYANGNRFSAGPQ